MSSDQPCIGGAMRRQPTAFTLVEMLVVIAIIGALAGLLLPAVMRSQKQAKIARARREVKEIEEAWKAYLLQYHHFPSRTILMMDSNAIAILRGVDSGAPNPENFRNMPFLDFRLNTPYYCDPWGKPGTDKGVYMVSLDTNGENKVRVGSVFGSQEIKASVAVWSAGPNRKDEDGQGDDITSWKD